MIKKLLIIYLTFLITILLLKILLMNYQKLITRSYEFIPQHNKVKVLNIDKQHEPKLEDDVNEYGIFTYGLFDHPNDIDIKFADLKNNMKILDAGCGMLGPSINFAKKLKNVKIYAVSNGLKDHKVKILDKIQENKLENQIIPIFLDYHDIDLKFKESSFDRIIFIESIGFSNKILELITKCYKLLKKGGKIYIRTIVIPNLNNQYLKLQFEEIENNLNGNLHYYQNIIYFLQKANFKDIKVSTIPLIFSDNMYKLPFLNVIKRLGLYDWNKIIAGNCLLSSSYVATK